MHRLRRIRPLPLVIAVVFLGLGAWTLPASAAERKQAGSQLEFGISMAKRGLWNEALFRFSRVLNERPGDPRVLNNMAVAYEAIGEFDQALEHYKLALEKDSANRELRRNYAQFLEFYQSLKPETPESGAGEEAGEAAPAEPEDEEPDQGEAIP